MNEEFEIQKYLESGLLEAYVLGTATPEEMAEVDAAADQFPRIKEEIAAFQNHLEGYALSLAVEPPPTLKTFIKASLQFMKRAQKGELSGHPVPELDKHSTASDYSEWINDPAHSLPADFEDYHAYLIGMNATTTSAIVWLRDGSPLENHQEQTEKFLILEGSCEIIIGEEIHYLSAGTFLAITPNHPHVVRVTSSIPCKLILQRTAA